MIDYLLEEHYKQQKGVIADTSSFYEVYGQPEYKLSLKAYDEKERLTESRKNRSAPYYKLKTVLDYWCSLWFWDVRDIKLLPNRTEWYNEVESILQIDSNELLVDAASQDIATQIRTKTKAGTLFDTSERIENVAQLAQQHRFFHNEIEFIEVFKERGGFDVIVGNPPWIKLTFDEKGVMSEVLPELSIRKTSAPKVKKSRNKYFENEKNFSSYTTENVAVESTSKFLNSIQNYHLLKGQQTDIYKCVLVNSLYQTNLKGICGLVHPESIYDDSKGSVLRKYVYKKLLYHFHFKNILKLFQEVHHRLDFSANIYSGYKNEINFKSISNLLHPSQIEIYFNNKNPSNNSLTIKNEEGNWIWNLQGNNKRIIDYNLSTLKVISELFDSDGESISTKLINLQSSDLLNVLAKITSTNKRIKDYMFSFSEGYHETSAVADGRILNEIKLNDIDNQEIIITGPMVSVSYPIFKMPVSDCSDSSHYDLIDLFNFDYPEKIRTIYQSTSTVNKDVQFKIGFRKMVDIDGERTLQPCLLTPKMNHVNSVISLQSGDDILLAKILGLSSSVIYDFFIKTIGSPNLYGSRLNSLPGSIDSRFENKLLLRALRLNCINKSYSNFWESTFKPDFKNDIWSSNKNGLQNISIESSVWTSEVPLKNMLSRRQALLEIDVIVAMSFNLELNELIQLYNIGFSISKKFEDDTWYDELGNIVFTPSGKTMKGVGLDRGDWNEIKDMKEGETYEHTITKSELYHGKKITYHAPFTKCDRVEDYKTAWAHFEQVFNTIEATV